VAGTVDVDGEPLELATLGVGSWHHRPDVASTMDEAHRLAAAGAPTGAVVLADRQHAGRGRGGKVWHSAAARGVWCTLLERDVDAEALTVLSLRVGMAVAESLAPLVDVPVWLKWPNDVLVAPADGAGADWARAAKVAGVLVEARWREARVEWVAIGVGVNLAAPVDAVDGLPAGALRPGVSRAGVLRALLPAVRHAVRGRGGLSPAEQLAWQRRDALVGRRCVAPVAGVVLGVAVDGALRVQGRDGERRATTGSVVLADGAGPG
jgi:BirA family biotin operon repressor/biotin-[acetyl-CoA-carboxylase] ligase